MSHCFAIACAHGSIGAARLLEGTGEVDVTFARYNALRLACWGGHYRVVRYLLGLAEIETEDVYDAVFLCACRGGSIATLQLIYDNRGDMPLPDFARIYDTMYVEGNAEMCRAALDLDWLPRPVGQFQYAIPEEYLDIAMMLCDGSPESKLMIYRHAIIYNRIPIVADMLDELSIEDSAVYGNGIIYACMHGHFEMAELILSNARVLLEDMYHAFVAACEYGHRVIAEWLYGKIDIPPPIQQEAYFNACSNGHFGIVMWVCSFGIVDPRIRYDDVLVFTCKYGDWDMFDIDLSSLHRCPAMVWAFVMHVWVGISTL